MPDLDPLYVSAGAYALLILAVRTTLYVATRPSKADLRREARRQARTARLAGPASIPSPANDTTPGARHAVG